jgi:DNA-binding Lrp family transcriptional regulator
MESALVFIRVDSKIERMVINEIRNINGVSEAHYLFGPYDMYVKIDVETIEELQDILLNKIHNFYGIQSTTTCYIVE